MPIHKTIDDAEANKLLESEESHYLDVKRIEIKPSKLTGSVSAFANAAGGELFIGIGEVLIPGEAAHHSGMKPPAVPE
jgi:ATP-dependent DNA helicase RecG